MILDILNRYTQLYVDGEDRINVETYWCQWLNYGRENRCITIIDEKCLDWIPMNGVSGFTPDFRGKQNALNHNIFILYSNV